MKLPAALLPPAGCRGRRALAGLMLAASLGVGGCAGPGGIAGTGLPFRDPGLSMQAASEAIAAGRSEKQDVLAALGPATVVRFDSGHEVWVYRKNPRRSEAANAEFVILFSPSGIVKKTRIRPGSSQRY